MGTRLLLVLVLVCHLLAVQVAGSAFVACQERDGGLAVEFVGQGCCPSSAPSLAPRIPEGRAKLSPPTTCMACRDFSLSLGPKLALTRVHPQEGLCPPPAVRVVLPRTLVARPTAEGSVSHSRDSFPSTRGPSSNALRITTAVVMLC